ncbi:bifunctional (p)ppGpp synthetase/guanosine-3',5'-bis(diphosphate) 3'-pyrophosphohydrolase [Cyanobium sp. ATX 6A2]|uniref:HD domain-containing protein n=1 Tax=Cyanobium sp. ATX 6A2 TaxID=2823700 RepID=UPI0020CE963E|nr:HD domain-containing protein [Cyanobium sp. ATX 6A2]MCP9887863.1 bifunctional (p)ppGpp synthetase/guanosine-3',5'-bis(diphosphate) 3'-pyrophosphohydrolase [Cyanobium sp. ATX 6A2]
MSDKSPVHSPRYIEALQWAGQLHGTQCRKGKEVPYISHLIAVSALVWEDGGDEEEAIAALLHDAIEDCEVSTEQIAERFGERVARIVRDCTDTAGPVAEGGEKEAWLVRKQRYLKHLEVAELDSVRVSAADKAHNARDQMLDARRDPKSWSRFNAGIDGTAWYQLRIHQTLKRRLPGSRSTELLGEALQELLDSQAYRQEVPAGIAPAVWAAGYAERQEATPE